MWVHNLIAGLQKIVHRKSKKYIAKVKRKGEGDGQSLKRETRIDRGPCFIAVWLLKYILQIPRRNNNYILYYNLKEQY